jgi:4,5-DOPA dioxygenase extradiol
MTRENDGIPTLFVSHGAPDIVLSDVPSRAFLGELASQTVRPKAIVVASAHWTTRAPLVSRSARPETIHDFGGFPDELYRLSYPAPGSPEIADEIVRMLAESSIQATVADRGLDHGAWVPLLLAYPHADIPVLQVSLQPQSGAAHHLALGLALSALRYEGVLVLGSGSATHDLRALERPGSRAPNWVSAFDDWLVERAVEGDVESLVDYRARAPFAAQNHPTEEHYFPLLVALGAAGEGARGRVLHRSTTYGVLSMTAFAFE